MSVILAILAVALFAFAAFTIWKAPRAIAQIASAIVAGLAACTLALNLPFWQVSVIVLLVSILLFCVVFISNTPRTQKIVAAGSVMTLGVAVIFGVSTMLANPSSMPVSSSIGMLERGDVVPYPVTNTASSSEIDDAVKLASVNSNIPAIKYYAYDAEPGTYNFGPAIRLSSAEDGVARFGVKLTSDSLYAGTIDQFRHHAGAMSQAAAHRQAERFVDDRQAQMDFAMATLNDIEGAWLVDMGETRYDSLGMSTEGRNIQKMPKLTKFSRQPAMKQTLVIRFKDGTGMYLRVECDLQPALISGFANVPTPAIPERTPTVPPKPYTPPSPPPTGGATPPPPSTSPNVPPTTAVTTTTNTATTKTTTTGTTTTDLTTSKTTTKTTTTGSSTPTTSETPSTTVPTPTCPPEHPDCKDPDVGTDPPEGHTPAPAPSGEPETTVPVEPNPIDPDVPTDAPAPVIPAPGATNVPSEPRPTQELPAPVGPAPAPSDPGTHIPDPDAQSAPRMNASDAPVQEVPMAPIPVQEAPAAVAPAPELQQAPATALPQPQEAPVEAAPAPAEAAESALPTVTVETEQVEPMSFNQQSTSIQMLTLIGVLSICLLLGGSLMRRSQQQ